MRSISTHLDIYDDPRGTTLAKYAQELIFSEKVASSELLSAAEHDLIPDRLFALQVEMPNGTTRNKFAMHDEAHVVTSMIYFEDNCDQLPVDVMQKVAANLVNACAWYDVTPTDACVKVAMMGAGAATMGLLGVGAMKAEASAKGQQNQDFQAKLRAAQAAGVKSASNGVTTESPMGLLEKALGLKSSRSILDTYEDEANASWDGEGTTDFPHKTKKADLTGSSVMPVGTTKKPLRNNPYRDSSAPKTSHIHFNALIDTTPAEVKVASNYAHPHTNQYPIDTATQVKVASAYFDEHYREMPLQDRRVFAQSLDLRAQELGCKVAGTHLDYAGSDYGPHIEAEAQARISSFEGTAHEGIYREFQHKLAGYNPLMAVEVLGAIDAQSGADRAYGRAGTGFRDPYQAVFGKTAADESKAYEDYEWRGATDYVSGMDLAALGKKSLALDEVICEGFSKDFNADPIGIFKSLPDPHKVIIARLAKDGRGTYLHV